MHVFIIWPTFTGYLSYTRNKKVKWIIRNFLSHQIFPWQPLASSYKISVNTRGKEKTTNNIYNINSVKQVSCWKTWTLPCYHTNPILFFFIHFMCCHLFHSNQVFNWAPMCKSPFIFSFLSPFILFPNSLPLTLVLPFLILLQFVLAYNLGLPALIMG